MRAYNLLIASYENLLDESHAYLHLIVVTVLVAKAFKVPDPGIVVHIGWHPSEDIVSHEHH